MASLDNNNISEQDTKYLEFMTYNKQKIILVLPPQNYNQLCRNISTVVNIKNKDGKYTLINTYCIWR